MVLKTVQKEIHRGEAYFITDENNVRYLSNFTGTNGQIFLTQKKTWLLTDFRYLRVAEKVLPRGVNIVNTRASLAHELNKLIAKNSTRILYFEEKNLSHDRYRQLKKSLPKIKFKASPDFIEQFRVIKSAQELKLITKAQRIAEKVFLEIRRTLKPGKTEQQIAWEIEQLGHIYGADAVSFPSIVGFGFNSASPHHQNSTRKLKKGDMVLIDMGMKYKGYCSDMTRMIFTARPTPLQEKIYNLVLKAQETAIQKLKAGIKGQDADKWARDIITKAGYGKAFGHSLGHGIGLQVHESPYLSTGFSKPLPENTIVTVEPGIYLQNSFGVRIEDMVLIRHNKVINLTKIPKKIEDCIFPVS